MEWVIPTARMESVKLFFFLHTRWDIRTEEEEGMVMVMEEGEEGEVVGMGEDMEEEEEGEEGEVVRIWRRIWRRRRRRRGLIFSTSLTTVDRHVE